MLYRKKLTGIIWHPFVIYFIWLISLIAILFLLFLIFPKSEYASANFFENFTNWDGRYYISIAKYGYVDPTHYAFFPGYPLVIRVLSLITGNFALSAVLISMTSTLLACFIFYKLIKLDFKEKIARNSIFALLIFPTSFYFLMTYSEGLFLLLSLLTFYYFRKENFFLATFFGFFSCLTRFVGLVLIVSILIQIIINQGFNRKNWIILLAPLGFFIFCLYLYTQTQNLFYFIKAQSEWNRVFGFPWGGIWQAIINITQPEFIQKYPYVVFDLMFTVFGLGMAIRSFRFLPPLYSFYILGSVLLPLITSILSSMSRFLLPVFPIFIMIALIKNNAFKLIYLTISLLLLFLFALLFLNWYWIG